MPKISLDNLERYDGHLKDWCDARFAERKVHENWHEAGPSGAVSFYPVPNRPIDPIVNFAFTETLPEGTKGPDNPSTITGVSSITVTLCETVGVDETDYTVNLGDTYYGGSVDLSTGIMTVTWWGHVFDGTEAMNLAYAYEDVSMIATSLSGITPIPATIVTTTDNVAFCTHYPHLHDWGNHVGFAVHPNGIIRFFTPLSIASTVAELQAFFASQYANGTPVVLTYPVLTPTTVSLTPTQIYSLSQSNPYTPRINTVYSDQQSVLVRYPKSHIVTGSELDNAILSLGGD